MDINRYWKSLTQDQLDDVTPWASDYMEQKLSNDLTKEQLFELTQPIGDKISKFINYPISLNPIYCSDTPILSQEEQKQMIDGFLDGFNKNPTTPQMIPATYLLKRVNDDPNIGIKLNLDDSIGLPITPKVKQHKKECTCSIQDLMKQGCVCGNIKRYNT